MLVKLWGNNGNETDRLKNKWTSNEHTDPFIKCL